MVSSPILTEDKNTLRQIYRSRRSEISIGDRVSAAGALSQNALHFLAISPPTIIAGFYPTKDEIDCLPLLSRLEQDGHRIALPVIDAKAAPLSFRAWPCGSALEPGTFNVPIPPDPAEKVEPDIFLVPLLAFDRAGFRLGYGGGFYDRTLKRARAARHVIAVGLGFECQEVTVVPRDSYDEQLDWVLTPAGPIQSKG